ncbi:hypothetical protein MUN46_008265 [Mesosutterella sp. AGMB02718]|uniref:Uncharacterized protein n=1 Tax=Mesosutterella faecium TaxID=2925194 RepID=A0ABT7ING6_9BURK|nr:hypothetical protein [Mesosutterella sp. AGMB02718]MDL2059922.1 hypothetical protein [Mesosutterella sp. AGMB02718]
MDEKVKQETEKLLEGYGVRTSEDFCALKPADLAALYTDLQQIEKRHGLDDATMELVMKAILG